MSMIKVDVCAVKKSVSQMGVRKLSSFFSVDDNVFRRVRNIAKSAY
jgi:hypothetical protein